MEPTAAAAMETIQLEPAQPLEMKQQVVDAAAPATKPVEAASAAAAAAPPMTRESAGTSAATPASSASEQDHIVAASSSAVPAVEQENPTVAAAAALLTHSARPQRSLRASTLINSRATIADQQQRKQQEIHARIKLEQHQATGTIKQKKRGVKTAAAASPLASPAAAPANTSSPDEVDSKDGSWSPPIKPRRQSKVRQEPSKEEEDPPIPLPDLLAFPPPVEPVVAELAAGSLPSPPPLPTLPPAVMAQVLAAYNIVARKQGLLPPEQPIDDITAAATDEDEGSDEDYGASGKSKRKRKSKKRKGSAKDKSQAAKKKQRAIQSSTPTSKRSRPKKPALEPAAAAAAASSLPPVPLELLHPPIQQPSFTPGQFLYATTALSMLNSSSQLVDPTSTSALSWQAPLRSVSPLRLPSHDFTPLPFPPLPSSAEVAAYLASSPPLEEPGMEEETTLRSTSALSYTPLASSSAPTPLSVPSELADSETMSPRAVADAMLLSSPSLVPFSFAGLRSHSPASFQLDAQSIEAAIVPSPYPTVSMRSVRSGTTIPPIDPANIRFGHLDSEPYRQRVKHNAEIARRAAAAEFEEQQQMQQH